jgi:hypothetical protein
LKEEFANHMEEEQPNMPVWVEPEKLQFSLDTVLFNC